MAQFLNTQSLLDAMTLDSTVSVGNSNSDPNSSIVEAGLAIPARNDEIRNYYYLSYTKAPPLKETTIAEHRLPSTGFFPPTMYDNNAYAGIGERMRLSFPLF